MPKWLWDCSVWSVESFSVKYDYDNPSREIKNGCVWELRALSLNPNTTAKVLLPAIAQINPPKTD